MIVSILLSIRPFLTLINYIHLTTEMEEHLRYHGWSTRKLMNHLQSEFLHLLRLSIHRTWPEAYRWKREKFYITSWTSEGRPLFSGSIRPTRLPQHYCCAQYAAGPQSGRSMTQLGLWARKRGDVRMYINWSSVLNPEPIAGHLW